MASNATVFKTDPTDLENEFKILKSYMKTK